jgi:glycosyltransferase involved in cell wall biosynthesis
MKVALYYPWIYLKSGCERTIVELVRRSRHDWTIFTNRYEAEATFPELRSMNVVELPKVSVRRSFVHVIRAAWQLVGQKLPFGDEQMLFVFCEGIGDFVVFRNNSIPAACVCFTPLRAAFDPAYQENYLRKNGNSIARRFALAIGGSVFRMVDRIAWRRFNRIFAISGETRSRIMRGRLCKADKLEILHPGIEFSRMVPSGRYDKRFLIAGRIMWTKNIELGIAAFQELLSRRPDLGDFELVIAGFVDEKSKPYIEKLKALAAPTSQIKFVTSPSDQEMLALYADCYTLLYTPFNEDWGLVPLEAMALEKPVIAVDQGGPKETVIDGSTGFLVPPKSSAFSSKMEMLADDPALVTQMGRRGREHARSFSWEVFCDRLDTYISSFEKVELSVETQIEGETDEAAIVQKP